MQINFLDRTIAAVAPAWAAKRLMHRAQIEAAAALPPMQALAGEVGSHSSPTRRTWGVVARDARSDTVHKLPFERAASRELIATSPIAAGAIKTNVDRVVGTGLALVAQPNLAVLGWSIEQALEWKALVQREFSLWADSVESDVEQTLNFFQQQALVLESKLGSGDCFTLMPDGELTPTMPYALRLQVLEADRVGNPQGQMDTADIAAGVRLGAGGAPAAYHVYNQHPGSYLPGGGPRCAGQWIDRIGRSGRRKILHHFSKRRPGLPRGVPYLAPIVDCIKQIARYTEAEITAAVISAYLTVFIQSEDGSPSGVFQGEEEALNAAGDEVGLGIGSVVGLAPGEKANVVNPSRPNPNFGPFIESVITQIGMALGLPRELLIKQFNSSFSASKAALLDAWQHFRTERFWLANSFCQPVFETFMAEAVAIGRIPAPGFFADPILRWAYTRASWHGDSMGSINPKDEVAAYTAAVDARLISRERAEWELFGTGWDDTYAQKLAEHQRLKADGMLPTPKAGAAAPVDQPEPTKKNEGEQ